MMFRMQLICFLLLKITNAQNVALLAGRTLFLKNPNTDPTNFLSANLDFTDFQDFCLELWAIPSRQQRCEHYPVLIYGDYPNNYIQIDAQNAGASVDAGSYQGNPQIFVKQGNDTHTFTLASIPDQVPLWNQFSSFYQPARYQHFSFCINASAVEIVHHYYTDGLLSNTITKSDSWTGGFPVSQLPKSTSYLFHYPGTPQTSFSGGVDEIRIWNKWRSIQTIEQQRSKRLDLTKAASEGLVYYWNFDSVTTPTTDLVSSLTATFSGTVNNDASYLNPLSFYKITDYNTDNQAMNLNEAEYYLPPTTTQNFGLYFHNKVSTGYFTVTQFNAGGSLLYESAPLQLNSAVNLTSGVTVAPFQYTTSADRASCFASTPETFEIEYVYGPTHSTVTLEFVTVFPPATFTGVKFPNPVQSTLKTEGDDSVGALSILGSGFGTSEWLSGEGVTIEKVAVVCNKTPISDTEVRCTYPPGVGFNLSVTLSLCGNIVPSNIRVSYEAPVVASVEVFANNTMVILGDNFGPGLESGRYDVSGFTFKADSRIEVGDPENSTSWVACSPLIFLSDNRIDCALQEPYNSKNVANYYLRLQIGGQAVPDVSISSIQPVVTTGESSVVSEEEEDGPPIEIIAPVVAIGGVLIIALAVFLAIFLVRRRNPTDSRKAPFTPVSKKDFTPLIYGGYQGLSAEDKKRVGDLSKLEELLVKDDLKLAFATAKLTQITEADKVAKAMVIIFEAHNKTLLLLDAFIKEEVNNSETDGTLFRSNSMVSKMFKFYSRLIGLPYLYETIGPELTQLIFENLGLEVDPERMQEGTDLDEMRWMLMAQSQKILKSILNSADKCPLQIRILCDYLRKAVGAKFPESVNKTIGGFIFLRFFCPAVTSPESYGIVDEPPSDSSRRLLILMTKVLQNLSNNVEFGSKEPYMTKMNDFITSNTEKLDTFFSKLVVQADPPQSDVQLPKDIKENSLGMLSLHLQSSMHKVQDQELKAKLEEIFNN